MKTMWCWRCRADVPMLDEDEYHQVISLRGTGADGSLQERIFGPVLAEYERITGFRESNPNAIFHHRIADFGAPCEFCGKPLRTAWDKACGDCKKPVGG